MRRRVKFLLRSVVLLATPLAGVTDLQTLISALKAQDYQKALTLAQELKTQNTLDPRVLMLEGMANEGLKNKAEALRNYRSALKIKARLFAGAEGRGAPGVCECRSGGW